MTKLFLKAKHWQIFLLTFGIPFIIQIIFMVTMVTKMISNHNADPFDIVGSMMKYYPILVFLLVFFYYGWYYAVATGLQRLIPDKLKLKTATFRFLFFFMIIYLICFITLIMFLFGKKDFNPMLFIMIVPFHLFVMFCVFYCIYFVACSIKTAELKRKVTFSDYALEYFLIMFFPIGIWIIQPQINKLVEEDPAAV